ncbi:MAG: MBL fold metallo-hydrolase [Acidobacteriota bacterium]|nr:MBL fold metallo-hydrolase [Acidobacteriota bacterium]
MILRSIASFLFSCALAWAAPKTMDVYFIDVEGGQSTFFVSPSGQSMLVDTGWSGNNGRDADRIAAVAKLAGVKQIDYLLITHFHEDHVGGVPQLAQKLPIKTFVDHGSSVESGAAPDKLFSAYTAIRDRAKHIVVKPGDKVPIKGIDWEILTAGGNEIADSLPGAGKPNPFCDGTKLRPVDKSENARSVGSLITYGKFRMVDLGDLTWNKEFELMCPNNRIGTVDVYLTTHHGMNMSGPAAIVHALHPKVAIMNNGAKKGGSAEAWQTVKSSPGLEDIWQLHYAVAGGDANNVSEQTIANPSESADSGNWIKLSAQADGSFTVTNGRTGFSKTY